MFPYFLHNRSVVLFLLLIPVLIPVSYTHLIRDADRIIGLLEAGGLRDIHLIINRLRPDMIARGDMMSVDDVIEILAVDLIGTIPDDEQIVVAANQGEPLSGKKSQAEEEYKNICRRLLGEEVPFMEIRQKKGMFRRLGQIFRK